VPCILCLTWSAPGLPLCAWPTWTFRVPFFAITGLPLWLARWPVGLSSLDLFMHRSRPAVEPETSCGSSVPSWFVVCLLLSFHVWLLCLASFLSHWTTSLWRDDPDEAMSVVSCHSSYKGSMDRTQLSDKFINTYNTTSCVEQTCASV
jgi:hypothetical protein